MSLLEVRGLSAGYPVRSVWTGRRKAWRRVVEEVDLDLEAGSTLALVGESGSGKTTIARAILRLIRPEAGTVRLRGEDLLGLGASELRRRRRDLQMVFQDPWGSLSPRIRIADAVFEPLRIHGLAASRERSERARALLREVGLSEDLGARYPHELSGGQRQRVGLARALASGPAILIADEPVSALDLSVRGQILNLLQERQEERRLGLLLIAHDLAMVSQIADRIAVLHAGRIVEEGPAAAVLATPAHPQTRALLAAIPGARGRRSRAPSGDRVIPSDGLEPRPGACAFSARCPWAQERCRREAPRLETRSPGHRVACFVEVPVLGSDEPEDGTFAAEQRRDGGR